MQNAELRRVPHPAFYDLHSGFSSTHLAKRDVDALNARHDKRDEVSLCHIASRPTNAERRI